jgi:hypothetical protein
MELNAELLVATSGADLAESPDHVKGFRSED